MKGMFTHKVFRCTQNMGTFWKTKTVAELHVQVKHKMTETQNITVGELRFEKTDHAFTRKYFIEAQVYSSFLSTLQLT